MEDGSTRRKQMEKKKCHKTFHVGDIEITVNSHSGHANVPGSVLNTLSPATLRTSQ